MTTATKSTVAYARSTQSREKTLRGLAVLSGPGRKRAAVYTPFIRGRPSRSASGEPAASPARSGGARGRSQFPG